MRSVLFTLVLSLVMAGCSDNETGVTPPRAAEDRPAGATGSAPVTPANEGKPANDALVGAPARPAAAPPEDAVEYREITVPAGTVLPLELRTSVGSDTSSVEDPVRASLRRPIAIGGAEVLPAGTVVTGHVTAAARSARVKGRGRIAFRFNRIDLPGEGGPMAVQTGTLTRIAPATKKQDAAKIGAGAAGGAIVGGILGGGDGAGKGAAIGGGAGTAVVLSTRGKEVRLGAGAPVSVKLTAPLTVRVRVR